MKQIPMISSEAKGPLGIRHLPRLWLKVSLAVRDMLADGYPDIGEGYDRMVLTALNLKDEAVREFVRKKHPTYPQFEGWVKSQSGVNLNKAVLEKLNSDIVAYQHNPPTRQGILIMCGIQDDATAPRDAVSLNNLEDWNDYHKALLSA